MKKLDLIGKRFRGLIVLERLGANKHGQAEWKCMCDCGQTTSATTNLLNTGRKVSCGCKRSGIYHENRDHKRQADQHRQYEEGKFWWESA